MTEKKRYRGSTKVWGKNHTTDAMWPWAYMHIRDEGIEIQALNSRLMVRPEEVVELRYYSHLLPHFLVITQIDGEYGMASFHGLRREALLKLLRSRGFVITEEARWQPLNQVTKECEKYGLYQWG